MDVHIRVDLDDDGPVVIKSAVGAAAADQLRHERERLRRAAHPGVVALVAPTGDGAELRTRYAGEPVARWSGSLPAVAGLGAAVAVTLADLHALGIVHGRLDDGHILLGDDGRPRLCGFSPPPGDARPADDVAALGVVLADLLARAPTGRRSRRAGPGPRRGGRRGGEGRALGQVLERAVDPVATRRPSAAALADAILAAVPAAGLPNRDEAAPPARAGAAPPGAAGRAGQPGPPASPARHDEPDTLDRIWAFAGDETEDERWAAALGTGPPDLDPTRSLDATTGVDRARPDVTIALPLAAIDTPAWPSSAAEGATPPPSAAATAGRADSHWPSPPTDTHDTRPRPPARTDDTWPSPPSGAGDAWSSPASGAGDAWRGAAALTGQRPRADAGPGARHDRPAPAGGDGQPTARGWSDDPATPDGADGLSPAPGATADRLSRTAGARVDGPSPTVGPAVDPATGDALTRERRPAAGRVASGRTSAPDPDGPRGPRRRRWAMVAGAGLGAVALVAAGVTVAGPGGGADTPRPAPPARDDCPAVDGPVADVDGDGCPEALVVVGSVVDAGVARWSLGEPGDLATVGDWDCDGEASAALLRPSTGDVFVFAAWAAAGEPVTVTSTRRVDGGIGIRAETDSRGCDRLLVDLRAGGAAAVETAGPTAVEPAAAETVGPPAVETVEPTAVEPAASETVEASG